MHPDEQKLSLLQVGDQQLLFAEQPKELSRKLGLSWRAVVKLHADGLLSFDPAVVQGLDEGQEAELRFLATFITSDCDTSLLRKLLATLPKPYQAILEAACAQAKAIMVAKYDTQNPAALKELVAGGTQLKPFSKDILLACYKAAFELYDETAAANPKFKKIYDAWKPFRQDQDLWFRVAENTFDNFVFSQQAAKK